MTAQFFCSILVIAVVANTILMATAYLIFLERKVAAWIQDRIGPNRTNFSFGVLPFPERWHMFGLGQALADGAKLFFKEDYTPPIVDRKLFLLAPVLAVIPAMIGWAVIPWGGYYQFPGLTLPTLLPFVGGMEIAPQLVTLVVAPVSIGVLYMLAVSSLGVYGVVVGAYGSNNKYAFLGGLRATAQMLSYEIPMGVCVLIVILCLKTADTSLLVSHQVGATGGVWGLLVHPLLAIIFFTCILAETNRAPFDLAEAEQEIVGGFHTEFSSMKWALFFLAEYMHMITGAAFFTILFLGGWSLNPLGFIPALASWELPLVADGGLGAVLVVLAKFGVFVVKITLLIFVMMWIRWTLPRFRFDQLMKLAWRGMIPMMLLMLTLSALMVYAGIDPKQQWYWFTLLNIAVAWVCSVVGPLLPSGQPVNRRLPLAGSRFSPLVPGEKA